MVGKRTHTHTIYIYRQGLKLLYRALLNTLFFHQRLAMCFVYSRNNKMYKMERRTWVSLGTRRPNQIVCVCELLMLIRAQAMFFYMIFFQPGSAAIIVVNLQYVINCFATNARKYHVWIIIIRRCLIQFRFWHLIAYGGFSLYWFSSMRLWNDFEKYTSDEIVYYFQIPKYRCWLNEFTVHLLYCVTLSRVLENHWTYGYIFLTTELETCVLNTYTAHLATICSFGNPLLAFT